MGMESFGGRQRVRSEINVTPLVDVCLVLLIIFLVVTPMLGGSRDVQLPRTESPERHPRSGDELRISVQADRNVFVGSSWYPDRELAAKVREAGERSPSRSVVVEADTRLAFGDVKRVLRHVRDGGFAKVGLVAQRRGRS